MNMDIGDELSNFCSIGLVCRAIQRVIAVWPDCSKECQLLDVTSGAASSIIKFLYHRFGN